MKVLLLGVTGRVGSRLLPALVAHRHQVVAYVRDAGKLPADQKRRCNAIVTGSGTDSEAIKQAIVANECDAVVNAAGLAPVLSSTAELPAIFGAVLKAAADVRKDRTAPLRCWFLSGWSVLDHPNTGLPIIEYIPIYPAHRITYNLIKSVDTKDVAWSLFCASNMDPRSPEIQSDPDTQPLAAAADQPPKWSSSLAWVPLVGNYLNVMAQAQQYYAPLEDCTNFIAADLEAGVTSEFVGKRVGVKAQ